MDIAHYNKQEIRLETMSRDSYQIIYEASLRDDVSCVHCHTPVRFYLGIERAPYFYHPNKDAHAACSHLSVPAKKEKKETEVSYKEQNGFRIPTGRAISDTKEDTVTWKAKQTVKKIPAFMEEIHEEQYSLSDDTNFPLDKKQYKAVTTTEGPLLILAGAGSGKTRVLTARTAYMIAKKDIPAKSIMLVTFTAKAAAEMKERINHFPMLTRQDVQDVVIGTFHSLFYKIILHHDSVRWGSSRLLKFEWQRDRIMKEIAREKDLDEKEFAFDAAMQQISYWKNTLTSPESIKPADEWEETVSYLYKRYEEEKQQHGYFDFDDMLYGCYELLKNNPDLVARYQRRFHYFLIDEFQDINTVQYEIIRLLSSHTNNLCIVGDDDQSIYAFRGSDPTFILEFDQHYPDAKIITLSENYRSSHRIVSAANNVIRLNKKRRAKKMKAQYDSDKTPLFFFPYDEEEEATMIVQDIKERIEKGANPSDFAILYRTNTASRALFERLTQSSLPFIIEQDAESFYERRMIKSLLAFLRLSVNDNDEQALQHLLVSLFLKQSALQDVKALSILEDCSYIEALGKLTNVQSFQQRKLKKLVPLFKGLHKLSPAVAIEKIEKDMGFSDFVKKRGNEGNVMDKGSDDIRDFKVVARKFTTIKQLLDHVDDMIAKNKEMKKLSKQYKQAISLLTIHRSKGLEYKHVYLLSMVDGSLPHDYALESLRNGDHAPLEEERRLCYVAMTRAQETLYISIPQMRRGRTTYSSRFLQSLQ
ncbi:ATP-dependent helicase [Priestia taiwanensis]|uniref:DNA 3'-5' helicase n=1 Tax=Priestia taiwanensis TaxID=1347902 RepID=A0A917ASB7_9BACI|nr:ATP-dependent helicase [Priestia taiwanensis]MBM7364114.1 DNA helicase-2/ATP-dependent DNA helicase PcrA [Priestia taiwanensis]GGE71686.1 putative ATP-dependent DNA helicase YjcD [Priestia taiwanensis]